MTNEMIERIKNRALIKEYAQGASINETLELIEMVQEFKQRYNPETQIIIVWDIEDVQNVRPDLSDDQAMEVLLQIKNHHDATIGVNWDVIECVANNIFPEDQ